MSVWVHILVKNEERYLWYAVMSVIDHVDRVLLWDTGSTDNTIKIIKQLKKKFPDKISDNYLKIKSPEEFTTIRQEMLDYTKSDWFLVVDGDEVWWDRSITKVVQEIKENGNKIESIVVPNINLVGDIYHYQEKKAGNYSLAGKKGHFALRAINRKIPGLSSRKPHGTWGWTDATGKMVQDRDPKKIRFVDAAYMHMTHLLRGGDRGSDLKVIKRAKKLKYELGMAFPLDYYYPEVFFHPRPAIVPSPWTKMSKDFYFKSLLETPFRKIKRRLISGSIGY